VFPESNPNKVKQLLVSMLPMNKLPGYLSSAEMVISSKSGLQTLLFAEAFYEIRLTSF